MTTRAKSPSLLLRDKALERWTVPNTGKGPVARKYPDGLGSTLADATGASRKRIYQWLGNPDRNALTWSELCRVAQELGGNLRCMFSEQP